MKGSELSNPRVLCLVARRHSGAIAALIAALVCVPSVFADITIQTVDVWQGGQNYPQTARLSADGTTVVGTDYRGNFVPQVTWRWKQATGLVDLAPLNSAWSHIVSAISADGSVIAGVAFDGNQLAGSWKWSVGTTSVLDRPGGASPFWVADLSGDGRTSIGRDSQGSFRLTPAGQVVPITPPAGTSFLSATRISADGNVIASVAISADGAYGLSRTMASGATQLIPVPSNFVTGNISSISATGSTIVGTLLDPLSNPIATPFIWTETSGLELIAPPNSSYLEWGPAPISNDSVIFASDSTGPLLWTRSGGFRSLTQMLGDGGLDLSSIYLSRVLDASADGKTLLISGGPRLGEGGSLFLVTIPAPLAVPVAVIAVFVLHRRRRWCNNLA